jgi:hypothetical protein
MGDPWQILRDGGLPTAAQGSGHRPAPRELADATRAAIGSGPSGRDAEALAAWIFAWHHHWPERFALELGADAGSVLAWASGNAVDDGRYVKLRRIAIESLAQVL